MNLHTAGTLVEYRIVSLSDVAASQLTPDDIQRAVENTARGVGNEPVELRGTAPLVFVLPLFLRLKAIATEIIAREREDESAVVLFSLCDPEQWIRPHDVCEPPRLSEQEFSALVTRAEQTSQHSPDELKIDAQALFRADRAPSLEEFLRIVYALPIHKKSVRLHGDIPAVPACLLANWVMAEAREAWVENQKLT